MTNGCLLIGDCQGGRPLIKESLYNALKRTVLEEIGVDVEPLGVYKIEEVLHEEKTVLMFIAVAKIQGTPELKGRVKSHKWVDNIEVEKMDTTEFTAFYAKDLLLDYLSGNREYTPFHLIESQQYYDLDSDPIFQNWLNSGKKDVEPKA